MVAAMLAGVGLLVGSIPSPPKATDRKKAAKGASIDSAADTPDEPSSRPPADAGVLGEIWAGVNLAKNNVAFLSFLGATFLANFFYWSHMCGNLDLILDHLSSLLPPFSALGHPTRTGCYALHTGRTCAATSTLGCLFVGLLKTGKGRTTGRGTGLNRVHQGHNGRRLGLDYFSRNPKLYTHHTHPTRVPCTMYARLIAHAWYSPIHAWYYPYMLGTHHRLLIGACDPMLLCPIHVFRPLLQVLASRLEYNDLDIVLLRFSLLARSNAATAVPKSLIYGVSV